MKHNQAIIKQLIIVGIKILCEIKYTASLNSKIYIYMIQ